MLLAWILRSVKDYFQGHNILWSIQLPADRITTRCCGQYVQRRGVLRFESQWIKSLPMPMPKKPAARSGRTRWNRWKGPLQTISAALPRVWFVEVEPTSALCFGQRYPDEITNGIPASSRAAFSLAKNAGSIL